MLENTASPSSTHLPSVAVVILNWNGKAYLEQFLPSVMATRYANLQVVVADNGSTDDSTAFLEAQYPRVVVLKSEINEGFAKGYNTALQQVKADYYVLLNSDVEVDENWISPLVDLLETNPEIGACQPKILSYREKTAFEYAGACGGWIDTYGYPFARGRVFDHCEADLKQYDKATACFWASGAALFVRSSVFHTLGGFDDYFFAHQEEIDFCWRMQLSGWKVFVQPQSVVYHVGGGTLSKSNPKKTYLNYRNNLIMLYKNLPRPKAYLTLFIRLMLDGVAGIQALFTGKFAHVPAIIKAHFHFYGWILRHQEKSKFPPTRNKNLEGWYNGSIILSFFIGGKKTFLEIVRRK